MKDKTKTAYSYIRFSDRKQKDGDSIRRQKEWGLALCRTKGWVLDESYKPDEGVSAFRGLNATTGHLAGFLEDIRKGKVKPGSALLVESLDRLSRQELDPAWELFRSILHSGVEIVTREPERHYLPSDLNDLGPRIEVQAFFLRAFNESSTKSMRGKEYWARLRATLSDRKPIHKVLPAWLRLSSDRGRFEVVQEAAKAVKLIYRWASEGLGLDPITARLNQEGIKPIARADSWRRSYVAKIIRDKAVLGEFQPHVMKDGKRVPHGEPISGYFPAIVKEQAWYAVRQAVSQRGTTRGRNGVEIANLFTGLFRDARDGKVMHLTYTGSSRKNNGRVFVSYGARNGERGSANSLRFPYGPIERTVLATLRELTGNDFMGEAPCDREEEIASLAGKLNELDRKIATVQARMLDDSGIDALVGALELLGKQKKATAIKLERLKAEAARDQPTALGEAQSLATLLRKTKGKEERIALRVKIRARFRQLLDEAVMLVSDVNATVRVATIHLHFRGGQVRVLLLGWARRGPNRGMIEALTNSVPAEQAAEVPDLRRYRLDPPIRRFFDQHHAKLGPAIVAAMTAAGKARKACRSPKQRGLADQLSKAVSLNFF